MISETSGKSKRFGGLLWPILAAVIVIVGIGLLASRLNQANKGGAAGRFFPSMPASVEVVDYGEETSIFGDGSYCLVFRINEKELRDMLQHEGFSPVGIDTDPNHWRLSLCNSVLTRLIGTQARVEPTFAAFEKRTAQTDARVFYSTNENLATFLGFGRFDK